MHQAIITKQDALALVQNETNMSFPTNEIVYLTNEALTEFKNTGNINPVSVYFGTLVIQSFDVNNSVVDFQNLTNKLGAEQSLYIFPNVGLSPVKNVFNNVLFDYIQEYSGFSCHFYGWRFTRGLGWVEQSPTVTPGAGWSLADGVYTHTSGTTEQIYLGPWTVSSKIRVTVTFTGITAGSLDLQMDVSGVFGTISADGTYSFEVETDSSDGALFFVPTNDFDGSYDTTTLKIEKYTYV